MAEERSKSAQVPPSTIVIPSILVGEKSTGIEAEAATVSGCNSLGRVSLKEWMVPSSMFTA